jgi:septal ring factor EnvC (AmiA/AmiB activator)
MSNKANQSAAAATQTSNAIPVPPEMADVVLSQDNVKDLLTTTVNAAVRDSLKVFSVAKGTSPETLKVLQTMANSIAAVENRVEGSNKVVDRHDKEIANVTAGLDKVTNSFGTIDAIQAKFESRLASSEAKYDKELGEVKAAIAVEAQSAASATFARLVPSHALTTFSLLDAAATDHIADYFKANPGQLAEAKAICKGVAVMNADGMCYTAQGMDWALRKNFLGDALVAAGVIGAAGGAWFLVEKVIERYFA